MTPSTSLRNRLLSYTAPALGILVVYNFIFYSPLHRNLTAARTKLQRLESFSARQPNLQSIKDKLATAESKIHVLNREIEEAKKAGYYLVFHRADLQREYLLSTSPAMVMATTISLLRRHNLECIDCSPVSEDPKAGTSEPLKQLTTMLGEPSHDVTQFVRREMRITLRGRFQDLQSALSEMQVAPLGIFTVSLEMENSDMHTDLRIWILTIAV